MKPLPRLRLFLPVIKALSIIAVLALVLGLVWRFGPREIALLGPVDVAVPAVTELEAWAAATEADVRPGQARQIVWAGAPGLSQDLALVYLHGFSAGAQEIAPVSQQVAAALGANLFITRLTGHGLDGAALAQASAADWWRDTAEALAVGRRLGKKVVLIGTSTGATLVAEAARDPVLGPQIDGAVLISPNFGLKNPLARLLTWPFARLWVPMIAGKQRCFRAWNDLHAQASTTCYPTVALLPVAALIAHAAQSDFRTAHQPALLIWSDMDQVIDPLAVAAAADGWGGPVQSVRVTLGA